MAVVLATAMEKDRNRRYQTAEAFAEDLRRVREREPISAKPAGPILRARRWAQRNPVVATSAAALFVMLAGGLGVTAHFLGQTAAALDVATAERKIAQEERDAKVSALSKVEETLEEVRSERDAKEEALAETEEERRKVLWERYRLALADADTAIREGRTKAARQILEGCREEFRGWEWQNLLSGTDTSLVTLTTGEEWVTSLAFTPDGRRLIASTLDDVTDSRGGEQRCAVQVWDTSSNSIVRTLEGRMAVINGVAVSSDGGLIAASGMDMSEDTGVSEGTQGVVRIWDARSGTPLARLVTGKTQELGRVAFHPTRPLAVSMDYYGELFAWNIENRALEWSLDLQRGMRLGGFAFDPLGDRIACVAGSSTAVELVETVSGNWVGRINLKAEGVAGFSGSASAPVAVSWSPDGTRLAVGSTTGQLWIVDPATREVLHDFVAHNEMIVSVDFNASGTLLATASGERVAWGRQEAGVWDVGSGQLVGMLYGHTGGLIDVAFHPEGRLLATGATDGTVRIWDSKTAGSPMEQVLEGRLPIETVEVSPDGSLVAGGDFGGQVYVWDPLTGQRERSWGTEGGQVRQVVWVDGGKSIVTGHRDGTLRRFETASFEEEPAVEIQVGPSRELDETFQGLIPDGVWSIAAIPGSTKVLVADIGHARDIGDRLEAWDMQEGDFLWENTEPGNISNLAVDQTGTRYFGLRFLEDVSEGAIADGVWTRTIADGWGERPVHFHFLTVSPDGSRLAVAGAGGFDEIGRIPSGASLFLLDTETGALLAELKGHTAPVVKPAFMADGLRLVTGSGDGTVRIWGVEEGQSLSVLEGHKGMVFAVDVHPDGDFIVSASSDGTARVWLSDTGVERYRASRRQETLAAQARQTLDRLLRGADSLDEIRDKLAADGQLSGELRRAVDRMLADLAIEYDHLVDALWGQLSVELVLVEDMMERFPEMSDVPPLVRQKLVAWGQEYLAEFGDQQDYTVYLQGMADDIVMDPDLDAQRYEIAVKAAERSMEPWIEGDYWYATGLFYKSAAQIRLGDWDNAVENAEWAQFLYRDVEVPEGVAKSYGIGEFTFYGADEPTLYGVIAMGQYHTGLKEEAAETLMKLKDVMARVPRGDSVRWASFGEVLGLLEGSGGRSG